MAMNNIGVDIGLNAKFNPGNSVAGIRKVGQEADRTVQLVNRISNSAVQFSTIVGKAAHSAQQSFLQVDNRLRNLQRGMEAASSSAYSLSQRLNALGKGMLTGPGLSQFSVLNGHLRDVSSSALTGANSMRNLRDAAYAAGSAGTQSMVSLSTSTVSAIAGLATLTKFLHSATQQMERMDILRASYQRIMGARPDMSSVESMDKAMTEFWNHSKALAYQYGVAIDDVAGTMIEFARQGHSPSVVQYLTKNLAELRLMLATSTGNLVDMRSAMGSVITLMNQIGVTAVDAVDGLKLMAEYDIRTATSFSAVSDAMNRFAAAGKVAGMSMKEMIQVSTAFTEIGIKGARAGTALNTIVARIANTKKARAMLEELGVGMTVVEDGAVRAASTFERLVEGYKRVMASGSQTLVQRFGDAMAGTRMQSVLYAGLAQYVKQTRPQVNLEQAKAMAQSLSSQLTNFFSSSPIKASPTVAISGRNIRWDSEEVRKKLLEGVQPLMDSFIKEFEAKGSISLPSDLSLMKRLMGLDSYQEAADMIALYGDTFKKIRAMFDDFFGSVESTYDNVARLALSNSSELEKAREKALDTMRNTIQNQYVRAQNAFQESFLDPSAIEGYTEAIKFAVGMFGTLGTTIASIISPPTIKGFADIATSVRTIGYLIELYLGSQMLNMLSNVQSMGVSVFNTIGSSIQSLAVNMTKDFGFIVSNIGNWRAALGLDAWNTSPAWIDKVISIIGSSSDRISIWNRMLGADDMSRFETAPSLIDQFNEAVARTQVSSGYFEELSTVIAQAASSMEGLILPSSELVNKAAQAQEAASAASRTWGQYANTLTSVATSLELLNTAYSTGLSVTSEDLPIGVMQRTFAADIQAAIEQEKEAERENQVLIEEQNKAIDGFKRMAAAAVEASEKMRVAALDVNKVFQSPVKVGSMPNISAQVLNDVQNLLPSFVRNDIGMTEGSLFLGDKGVSTHWLNSYERGVHYIEEIARTEGLLRTAAAEFDNALRGNENALLDTKGHLEDIDSLISTLTQKEAKLKADHEASTRPLFRFEKQDFEEALAMITRFRHEGASVADVQQYIDTVAERLRRMGKEAEGNQLKSLFVTLSSEATDFEGVLKRVEPALLHLLQDGSFIGTPTKSIADELLDTIDAGSKKKGTIISTLRPASEEAERVFSLAPDNDSARQMSDLLEHLVPLLREWNELKEKGQKIDFSNDKRALAEANAVAVELNTSLTQARILAKNAEEALAGMSNTSKGYLKAKDAVERAQASVREIEGVVDSYTRLGANGYKDMYVGEFESYKKLSTSLQDLLAPSITKVNDATRGMLQNLVKTDDESGERIGRLADAYKELSRRADEYKAQLTSENKNKLGADSAEWQELVNGATLYRRLAKSAKESMDEIDKAMDLGHARPDILTQSLGLTKELEAALKSLPTYAKSASGTNFAEVLHNATLLPKGATEFGELKTASEQLGNALKVLGTLAQDTATDLSKAAEGSKEKEEYSQRLDLLNQMIEKYRLMQTEAQKAIAANEAGQGTSMTYKRAGEITGEASNITSRLERQYKDIDNSQRALLQGMINGSAPTPFDSLSIDEQVAKQRESIKSLALTLRDMNREQREAKENKLPLPYTEEELQTVRKGIKDFHDLNTELETLKKQANVTLKLGKIEDGGMGAFVQQRANLIRRGENIEAATAGVGSVVNTDAMKGDVNTVRKQLVEFHASLKDVQAAAKSVSENLGTDVVKSIDAVGATSEATEKQLKSLIKELSTLAKKENIVPSVRDSAIEDAKAFLAQMNPGVNALKESGITLADKASVDSLRDSLAGLKKDTAEVTAATNKYKAAFYSIKGNPEAQQTLRALNAKTLELKNSGDALVASIEKIGPASKPSEAEVKNLQDQLARFKEAKAECDALASSLDALIGTKAGQIFRGFIGGINTALNGVMAIYSWFMRIRMVVNIVKGILNQINDYLAESATNSKQITEEFEAQARLQNIIKADQEALKKLKDDQETMFGSLRDRLSSIGGNRPLVQQLSREMGVTDTALLNAIDSYRGYLERYWNTANELAAKGKNIFEESGHEFVNWATYIGDYLGISTDAMNQLKKLIADYLKATYNFDIDKQLNDSVSMMTEQINKTQQLAADTANLKAEHAQTVNKVKESFAKAVNRVFEDIESWAAFKTTEEGLTLKQQEEKIREKFLDGLKAIEEGVNGKGGLKGFNTDRLQKALTELYGEVDLYRASAGQIAAAFGLILEKAKDEPQMFDRALLALQLFAEGSGHAVAYADEINSLLKKAAESAKTINENQRTLDTLSVPIDKAEPSVATQTKLNYQRQGFAELDEREKKLGEKKDEIDLYRAEGKNDKADALGKEYIAELEDIIEKRKKLFKEFEETIKQAEGEISSSALNALVDAGLPESAGKWQELTEALSGILVKAEEIGINEKEAQSIQESINAANKQREDALRQYNEDMKEVLSVQSQINEKEAEIAAQKKIQAESEADMIRIRADTRSTESEAYKKAAEAHKDATDKIAALEEEAANLEKSIKQQSDEATEKFKKALASAQAGLQKAIDTLFAGVNEAGRKLIAELMQHYNIYIDAWNETHPEFKIEKVTLDEELVKKLPKDTKFENPKKETETPKPAPTKKQSTQSRTQIASAAGIASTQAAAESDENKNLRKQVDEQQKRIDELQKQAQKLKEQAARAGKSSGGGRSKKTDPNKEFADELVNRFKEELDDLKIAYQTVQDAEGNIIEYLDRTKSSEYLEAQIDLLKQQRAEIEEFLRRPNLDEKVRRKFEKLLREKQLAVVKLQLEIDTKAWELQKSAIQFEVSMLQRQMKLSMDFYSDRKKNQMLEQRLELMDKIWKLQTKIFEEEYKKAKASGEEAKIQQLAQSRVNDILQRQADLLANVAQRYELMLKKNIGAQMGTVNSDYRATILDSLYREGRAIRGGLYDDPYKYAKMSEKDRQMARATDADKYPAATAARNQLISEFMRVNPSYFGRLGGTNDITRAYQSVAAEFGKVTDIYQKALPVVTGEIKKLEKEFDAQRKEIEDTLAGDPSRLQAALTALDMEFENAVDGMYSKTFDEIASHIKERISAIKMPDVNYSTSIDLNAYAKMAEVDTPVEHWIKKKTEERIEEMKKAGLIGSEEEIAAAAKEIRKELQPQVNQLKKEGIMDSFGKSLPTTLEGLKKYTRDVEIFAEEWYEQAVEKALKESIEEKGLKGDAEAIAKEEEKLRDNLRPLFDDLSAHLREQGEKMFARMRQLIVDTIKEGWEEGFEIGLEYGFSSEGWAKFGDAMKKRFAKVLNSAIYNRLHTYIEQMVTNITESMTNGLQKVLGNSEWSRQMAGFTQDILAPMFSSFIGGLIGMAIGSLFTDYTSEIEKQAEAQLKQQRDSINAQGFSWSYSKDNASTPYYEFSPPVTQESIKVVKYNTTFNISTDAAMAMASHRRELERVCSEIIENWMRAAKKTVGASS